MVYLCAPHNWGEPILPEILHTPVKRERLFPSDWCKAGNAHRRCPRRAHKTIRSVVYLCAPHNWGEPILPEILNISVKRGKVISLLTGARQATPTAGALGERTRPYGVWSICAHPITGVNPYSRRYCIPVKRGKVISLLTGARQATPTAGALGERTRPYGVWSICAHPITGVNPYSRRYKVLFSQEGKGYFLLTGARQATPTAGALGERTRPYGVWSICAQPHNWGEPILPETKHYSVKRERLFPS